VAGFISTNNVATAGIAPNVRLRAVKIANCRGESEWSWIVAGILWAADTGNHVANISYSAILNPHPKRNADVVRLLSAALAYARSKGTLVVASAGNDGRKMSHGQKAVFPCAAGALCVGATTRNDQLADMSNYGVPAVPIVAPGGGLPVAPYPQGKDTEFLLGPCSRHSTVYPACGQGTGSFILSVAGTSMAAPQVAGAAALLAGSATPDEVRNRLLSTADNLSSDSKRLNVYRAVQ
jgi:subtilisin family serine protease